MSAKPIDWSDWIKSDEGKRAATLSTLPKTKDGEIFLENRLWSAFVAGAKYERDKVEQAPTEEKK